MNYNIDTLQFPQETNTINNVKEHKENEKLSKNSIASPDIVSSVFEDDDSLKKDLDLSNSLSKSYDHTTKPAELIISDRKSRVIERLRSLRDVSRSRLSSKTDLAKNKHTQLTTKVDTKTTISDIKVTNNSTNIKSVNSNNSPKSSDDLAKSQQTQLTTKVHTKPTITDIKVTNNSTNIKSANSNNIPKSSIEFSRPQQQILTPDNLSPISLKTEVNKDTKEIANSIDITSNIPAETQSRVFPVGFSVNQRSAITSVLVRGNEDGSQAINFQEWLLPYDSVIDALNLKVKSLPSGEYELSAPGYIRKINPNKLRTDKKLGLVFSVSELQTLLNLTVEFNINEYAVELKTPWSTLASDRLFVDTSNTAPMLDGLQGVSAPQFALSAVEQRFSASGGEGFNNNYRGELKAIGTIGGGSWFIQTDQNNLRDLRSWRISQAQFLRQTKPADYIVGSQAPFWLSQGMGDYWGFTTIQRHGFTPNDNNPGAAPDTRQRQQAVTVGKVITGKAEPGTLIRLTQGITSHPIAEVVVDSSGIYRFPDVQVDSRFLASNYRLLLYPRGQLTETPEIRDISFSAVPGQLPQGASSLVISGGMGRQFSGINPGLIGNFSDFRGGIAQRWGVSEDLTVGIGGIYDESFRGLGEVFYQPKGTPLRMAFSGLSGNKSGQWDINTDISYDFSPRARARFASDRNVSRLDFDWRVTNAMTLLGGYDNRDGIFSGFQYIRSHKNSFTSARVTFNSNNFLRWSLSQRLGQTELTSFGNEISTQSQLTYNFSGKSSFDPGHSLYVGYETGNYFDVNNNLTTLGWRYRSPARSLGGGYLWDAQLGYGMGSSGSGIIATLGTNVIPGLRLQGRYQGVSLGSDQSSFSLELVSGFETQRGIKPDEYNRSQYLRTLGGVLVKPYFDDNQNGKRDISEKIYTDNAELLLSLNNQYLKNFQPETKEDGILMQLKPGRYRLDIDPAGNPIDWHAITEALAVDVVAGGYTTVEIPFVRDYTRTGLVTDANGKPVAGVRVEAIQKESGLRRVSVTNSAGVYYLQGLSQGFYTIEVAGKEYASNSMLLEQSSESFKEVNLQLTD
jgi:Carboxypeptidase regulatory-like domain